MAMSTATMENYYRRIRDALPLSNEIVFSCCVRRDVASESLLLPLRLLCRRAERNAAPFESARSAGFSRILRAIERAGNVADNSPRCFSSRDVITRVFFQFISNDRYQRARCPSKMAREMPSLSIIHRAPTGLLHPLSGGLIFAKVSQAN